MRGWPDESPSPRLDRWLANVSLVIGLIVIACGFFAAAWLVVEALAR